MGKKKRKVEEVEGGMDMSPMIDMVFLLLVFFVVNAQQITVKKDTSIKIPVASNGGDIKSANGCIVVNVYADGTRADNAHWGTEDSTPLMDEKALYEYIKDKAEQLKKMGYDKPGPDSAGLSLYLRGDQDSLFKHTKKIMQIGGTAGVNAVMFGTVPH